MSKSIGHDARISSRVLTFTVIFAAGAFVVLQT
jgi:hypothetical protein